MSMLSQVILIVGFVFAGLSSVEEAERLQQEPQEQLDILSTEAVEQADVVEPIEIVLPTDVEKMPFIKACELKNFPKGYSACVSGYALTLQSDPKRDTKPGANRITYTVLVSKINGMMFDHVCDDYGKTWAKRDLGNFLQKEHIVLDSSPPYLLIRISERFV